MCGVVGIYRADAAATYIALGLNSLQHRGEEAAGIVTYDGSNFHIKTALGLVGDNFSSPKQIKRLPGYSGIGHVRYSTTGESIERNIQPFCVEFDVGGFAIAHNGNLTNYEGIKKKLMAAGAIFQSTSDTEAIIHLMALSDKKGLVDRLIDALSQVVGAYSLVGLSETFMVGVRDPHGVRPLSLGKLGNSYILASETVVFDILGAEFIRDIEPGEVIVINEAGLQSFKPFKQSPRKFCIFEHIYFARPDSVIDRNSVYEIRKRIGRHLAQECGIEADLVIPVPDSGTPAALGYSEQSGIPFDLGIVRSHYVGRTFIQPTKEIREHSVKLKLNANSPVINGKRIILIDDSLVRGTTSKNIVRSLREAGAKEIHMRIAAPPTKYSCFYGIDTPNRKKLIAATHSLEEITRIIGADSLCYISVDGLHRALFEDSTEESKFCNACFTGKYEIPLMDCDNNLI
jgi:amidophosphoribosyltransferase